MARIWSRVALGLESSWVNSSDGPAWNIWLENQKKLMDYSHSSGRRISCPESYSKYTSSEILALAGYLPQYNDDFCLEEKPQIPLQVLYLCDYAEMTSSD